jgi:hypothetical protein
MVTACAGDPFLYQCTHTNHLTMKRITLFMTLLALLAVIRPLSGKAQFLKNLTSNIKQTLQNRANGKTNQTTNSLLDKVDSATRVGGAKTGKTGGTGTPGVTGAAGGSVDTSGMNRVLGAFAKTAQENPNDTNQADLVMKSLGRLTGGDGVSPQDSAAAIKGFMTASGGSGYFYLTVTSLTSTRGNSKDTMSMWFTNGGEGRAEIQLPIPGVQSSKIISIGHSIQPKYSMILDDQDKTYTLNIIDTALINEGGGKYQVTKVGTEAVSGYSCIHSRLVNTIGSGAFKSTTTYDVWTSTTVPGYSLFSKIVALQGSQGGMLGALAKVGAAGFLVKMTSASGKDYSMVMQLMKVQQQNCPATMFEIPRGYTNEAISMPQRMLKGSTPAKH